MKRFASLTAAALALAAAVALPASGATSPGGLPTLHVALSGKSITISGQEVSGAVDVQTTVSGEAMGTTALLELDPGVSAAQLFAAAKGAHGDLNALDSLAVIVFDQDANKGQLTNGETVLAPGNYVAIDGGSGHKPAPHTTFTVTASPSPAALPSPSATETTIEFAFKGPSVLHDGQLVRALNAGYLVHMDDLLGVANKATGLKVIALLKAGKDNQAGDIADSNNFASFAEALSHGSEQQAVLDAPPGYYVQACFMDTQDGREHTQLGMERLVRIVK